MTTQTNIDTTEDLRLVIQSLLHEGDEQIQKRTKRVKKLAGELALAIIPHGLVECFDLIRNECGTEQDALLMIDLVIEYYREGFIEFIGLDLPVLFAK